MLEEVKLQIILLGGEMKKNNFFNSLVFKLILGIIIGIFVV